MMHSLLIGINHYILILFVHILIVFVHILIVFVHILIVFVQVFDTKGSISPYVAQKV